MTNQNRLTLAKEITYYGLGILLISGFVYLYWGHFSDTPGPPAAIRYLYEGTLVSAEEALAVGLVDLIYPPERLHAKVQTYAESLAQKPAKALAAIRSTITEGGAMSFEEGLKIEYNTAVKLCGTKDFSEGIRAFLEKRKPNWE